MLRISWKPQVISAFAAKFLKKNDNLRPETRCDPGNTLAREWRAGSSTFYFINFGAVEAPTRKKRFSAGRRPAWLLCGPPSSTQASPRGPAPTALPSATRHRGMPGRLQESIHLKPGSRLLAALDECVALKSTIEFVSGQQTPTYGEQLAHRKHSCLDFEVRRE